MDSNKGGFLDSSMESTCTDAGKRNPLIMIQVFARRGRAGFQLASPVNRPDARKLARCAPPYTQRAGEEPWEGVSPMPMRHLTTGRSEICVVWRGLR